MTVLASSSFFQWWRLTRPWNVLAMGLMVGTVMHWQGVEMRGLLHLGRVGWLLVPMLVGAGGNLINDYFDVREDRINKPDKALVGRTVKRRVVMVTHWGFTVAALAWSAWLSSSVASLWPFVMTASFGVVLSLYSPLLKGRGAWGNVAISMCVAGLVVWGGLASAHSDSGFLPSSWTWAMAGVLGGLNLLREWVKDVQDMEGDRAARHRTLALRLSASQNRWGLVLGCVAGMASTLGWLVLADRPLWAMALSGCTGLVCVWRAWSENPRSLSAWIKVWMGSLFLALM